MTDLLLVVSCLLTLVGAVGAVATAIRRWPQGLDRTTGRRIAKALNRGRLPSAEPHRSIALSAARSRAMHGWLALSAAGVALLMARNALGPSNHLPAGLWWAVAALAAAGAALNALFAIQAARAIASA